MTIEEIDDGPAAPSDDITPEGIDEEAPPSAGTASRTLASPATSAETQRQRGGVALTHQVDAHVVTGGIATTGSRSRTGGTGTVCSILATASEVMSIGAGVCLRPCHSLYGLTVILGGPCIGLVDAILVTAPPMPLASSAAPATASMPQLPPSGIALAMDRALFIAGALVGASEAVIGAVMNADDGCASMLEPASVPEREPPPSKTRGTEGEEGSEHATAGIVSETGTGTTDEEEPEQADVCHATKLASVLRQLYSLRSALGSARHEANALRGERDAAVREADRLAEENGKLRYRIKHLVRAVREADDRAGEPAAGAGDDRGSSA